MKWKGNDIDPSRCRSRRLAGQERSLIVKIRGKRKGIGNNIWAVAILGGPY
jgi:hypothetical protein